MRKVHTLKLRIPSATDSRAGDEAALEALNGSLTGLGTGWSSDMSLSDSIDGVTTDTIGGELRVIKLNFKSMQLTGNIEIDNWENLKQCTYINFFYNNLVSGIPQQLIDLPKLVHLYLNSAEGYETEDPHEEAQTGGGDVHPGKNRAAADNHFTGNMPAPANPANSVLEWLILNWTDTGDSATDGISSISPELFDVTTFVGLQILENNGVADLPFPQGIVNMSNLNNLALGVSESNGEGYLTGQIPNEFNQLSNLKFLRISENRDLVWDFDTFDFTGMDALRNIVAVLVELRGGFPASLIDGSLANLVGFNFNFPAGDGMEGTLSSGSTKLQIAMFRNNNVGGDIPADFWDNDQLINTDFSFNSLTGIGTDDLTVLAPGFWQIRNLRWANNDIEGRWPNLAWEDSDAMKDLSRVHFQNNRYVFSDMLWVPSSNNPSNKTIFDLYNDFGLSSFIYSPQQNFGSQNNYDSGTDTIDFSSILTHTNNSYQWKRNGSNISGSTATLDVSGFNTGDEIDLVATNPEAPDLTLNSVTITL